MVDGKSGSGGAPGVSVRSLPHLGATTFNMGGLANQYQIRHQIGQGGMGFVYLAYEPRAERYVAVKVVHPSFFLDEGAIERFTRGAHAASQLRHHHTTALFDFGRTDEGLYYMVLELLRGRSLYEVLQEQGPFHYLRAVHVLRQICGSLEEAHRLGIVHRDLKPDNVSLETVGGKTDFVKVLDFGIAQVPQAGDSRMTQPGEVCGTPIYMSPEQAAGIETDARSDIYALGVLLWELLTGHPPFGDAPPLALMMKHVYEPPPPFPEPYATRIPAKLLVVLYQMLEKKPERRPQTCTVLRQMLRDATGLEAISQPVGAPQPRAPVSLHGGPSAHMRPAAHGFVPAPQIERLTRTLSFKSPNGGAPLKLGASGPERAVVYCGPTPAADGTRMVLLGDEEALAGVRLIGDVEGVATGYPDGCVELAWVRIVSSTGGRQLREVLELLRIPVKRSDLDRPVPPGTFLVYEPLTGKLQSVRPGEV
jgi:serine/threonine-protein kinase